MRRWKLFIGVIAVVVVVIGWYFFRPEMLFIDRAVNEQFPAGAASDRATILAKGSFRGLAHETRGAATIYQLPDGSRTLRLTDFETSNGPDVCVYLVAAPDAKDNDTVRSAGFIHACMLGVRSCNPTVDEIGTRHGSASALAISWSALSSDLPWQCPAEDLLR